MKDILSGNIARLRRERGLTQEELAASLGITYQAVSKWETGQTMPDLALLPKLAGLLRVTTDRLLGYSEYEDETPFYESAYRKDAYFWGVAPSDMCLRVLALMPPVKPLTLLDIGCGEGKDAVFFARCGYEVSAFDISEAGLDKLKRLAESARVHVRAIKANIWDYRLEQKYDVLYSSGVLHYIRPDLRGEIIENYRLHTAENGLNALHVFVEKPFIGPAPEHEAHSYKWRSGDLFGFYHDWYIEHCTEYVFDCMSSGIPHRHAANRLFARNGPSGVQGGYMP